MPDNSQLANAAEKLADAISGMQQTIQEISAPVQELSKSSRSGLVSGMLARGAMQGGITGAASRVALGGMALAKGGGEKGAAGSIVGMLAKDMASLSKELVLLPKRVKDFGANLLESQRSISGFNGDMATAFAKLDINRLKRQFDMAQTTGAGASLVAKSQDRLEKELAPWAKGAQNAKNWLQAVLSDAMENAVGAANDTGAAKWILNQLDANVKAPGGLPPIDQLIKDITSGQFSKQQLPPLPPIE